MGLSNSENKTYITVKDGFLHVGKGDSASKYDSVTGFLIHMTDFEKMVGKEGAKKPKHALQITLQDGETVYVLEGGAQATFSKMFAGYLGDLRKGDCIRIRVRPNDREPASTSCFIEKQDAPGGEFHKVTYQSFKGDAPAALEAIRKHETYAKREKREAVSDVAAMTQFIELTKELGWPDVEDHQEAYSHWIARMLKRDVADEQLSEADWQLLVSRALVHKNPQAPTPKELRDLVAKTPAVEIKPDDEYDPFEDE